MTRYRKKQNNFIGTIIYLIIAFMLVAILGVGAVFFVNSTTKFEISYEYGIPNNIKPEQQYRFKIVRANDKFNGIIPFFYNVKVVANLESGTNFKYINSVDGKEYYFADGEYTEAFRIDKYDDYFMLVLNEHSMEEIIGSEFVDCTVSIPHDTYLETKYFYLVVSAGNDSNAVKIPFRVNFPVKNINVSEKDEELIYEI